MESLGRECELDSLVLEPTEEVQVDRLLYIHVRGVVRDRHEEDGLDVERKVPKTLEVTPIEPNLALAFDHLPNDSRRGLQLLGGGVVGQAEGKDHPALLHSFVISDSATE